MSPSNETVLVLSSIEDLRAEGRIRDAKIDKVLEKLEPVPGLVKDMSEIQPKVDKLEAESHRRAGVIAVVCTIVGMLVGPGADWLLSLLGKK